MFRKQLSLAVIFLFQVTLVHAASPIHTTPKVLNEILNSIETQLIELPKLFGLKSRKLSHEQLSKLAESVEAKFNLAQDQLTNAGSALNRSRLNRDDCFENSSTIHQSQSQKAQFSSNKSALNEVVQYETEVTEYIREGLQIAIVYDDIGASTFKAPICAELQDVRLQINAASTTLRNIRKQLIEKTPLAK